MQISNDKNLKTNPAATAFLVIKTFGFFRCFGFRASNVFMVLYKKSGVSGACFIILKYPVYN